MSTGLYPGLQMRIDEARRHAEIPPTTAPPVMSYLRISRLHLPHLHLRRHAS